MTIRFALIEVLDHRHAHGFGCAKTKESRVADVQRDDLIPFALHLMSTLRQLPADLVANVVKALTCMDGGTHRCLLLRVQYMMDTDNAIERAGEHSEYTAFIPDRFHPKERVV